MNPHVEHQLKELEWEMCVSEGQRRIFEQRFDLAERSFEEAVRAAEAIDPDSWRVALSLAYLAHVYLTRDRAIIGRQAFSLASQIAALRQLTDPHSQYATRVENILEGCRQRWCNTLNQGLATAI